MNGFNSDLPPPDLYDAQIFDVRDLGILPTSFGPTHKVAIRFRVESRNRHYLVPRTYTYKVTSRSHLGRDIASLIGQVPEPDFNLGSLVGLTCQLHVGIEPLPDQRQRALVLGILPSRNLAPRKLQPPFTAKQNKRCHLPLGVDF
jgi:hypothetical protein